MRAPTARRPPPVARMFPQHGRCGGLCRAVAGVECGGGSFWGWLGVDRELFRDERSRAFGHLMTYRKAEIT
jgi:hypothetical protein